MKSTTYDNLLSKLNYFFSSERKQRDEVQELLSLLSKIGDPLVFGGMPRDIALGGTKNFCSDVDIVMSNTSKKDFDELVLGFNHSINHFGGTRFNLSHWPVDVWRIENTWAFKENFFKLENEDSLLDTTFFNWDAILFNYKAKTLSYKENYFSDLENKILDINFEKNPNILGALKRTVKFLKNNEAKATRKLCSFFVKHQNEVSFASYDTHIQEIQNISKHMEDFLKTDNSYFKLQVAFDEIKAFPDL